MVSRFPSSRRGARGQLGSQVPAAAEERDRDHLQLHPVLAAAPVHVPVPGHQELRPLQPSGAVAHLSDGAAPEAHRPPYRQLQETYGQRRPGGGPGPTAARAAAGRGCGPGGGEGCFHSVGRTQEGGAIRLFERGSPGLRRWATQETAGWPLHSPSSAGTQCI